MAASSARFAVHAKPSRRRIVAEYYKCTTIDYRLVWQNRRNLAFHFGYHEGSTRTHAEALENANRTLARLAGIAPGDRVLDAGCGVGGSCFWLATHLQARAVGIALGEDAIAQARRVAVNRGLEGAVRFDVADFTALPYADSSFDVVWALESVCHAQPKLDFYLEAHRVLRPGGRLVLADFMRRRRGLDPDDEEVVRTWLDGWAIPDLDTAEEHAEAAERAGMSDARVQDFTPRVRYSLDRLHRRAIAATPVNWLLHSLGLRNKIQHANVVSSLLQHRALRLGAWFYGVLTATKR